MITRGKINLAAFILGFALSAAAGTALASGGIRYAVYNGAKVIYNGRVLNLKGKRLISLAKDKERYSSNYMPARAVFEAMGLEVLWDEQKMTVQVMGSPKETAYPLKPYERRMANTYMEVEDEPRTSARTVPYKKIEMPEGLASQEANGYKLMAEILAAEMDDNKGLASVLAAAGEQPSDPGEEKELAKALYSALSPLVTEGSKKALSTVNKPGSSSSSEYTEAYNGFKGYVEALEKMLEKLKAGDIEGAYTEFDNAVELYLAF